MRQVYCTVQGEGDAAVYSVSVARSLDGPLEELFRGSSLTAAIRTLVEETVNVGPVEIRDDAGLAERIAR